MKVDYLPKGYHNATPYLVIDGAADAIEFYKKAFGAEEIMRMNGPQGKIGHAEIKIGDSVIMLADEAPHMGAKSPKTIGGTPVSILLYVKDVDVTMQKAVECGATITHPIENKFYGDRMGGMRDPFGHQWHLSTHVKDVSPEEMKKAAEAMSAAHSN